MRPGGPLVSKAELKRRKPLKRSTPLSNRPKPVSAMSPAERAVLEAKKAAKKAARKRSGGVCEVCGMRQAREFHHRKNASQGGLWAVENGLDVDRLCHDWITDNPVGARVRGWTVWEHEDPAMVEVWRRGDAWVLLGADNSIVPVIRYLGGPYQCRSHLDGPSGGALRCALGVLHDDDHECGLVTWPQTSKEMAACATSPL